MMNGRVKSRFVAAEVARDMIVRFAATLDGRHRPRSVVFYNIVAAFEHR